MGSVVEPPRWLLPWTRTRIAWAGAVFGSAPLLATALAPPLGDGILAALALGFAAAAGFAWRQRRSLESLPLVLGEVAVRQIVEGEPTLRVRVWLGHGRVMEGIEAEGRLHLPHGATVEVPIAIPALRAYGPVTLTARLPPLAAGELQLDVRVRGGGRTWSAHRRYPLSSCPLGPLASPVRRAGRRLDWDRSGWDRAESERS